MTHRLDTQSTSTVLGDGLMLSREGGYGLAVLSGGRAQPLGTFTDVRDAWRAVDALDLAGREGTRSALLAA